LKPLASEVLGAVNVEFEFSELARQPESVVVEPKSGTVPEIPNIFYITIPKLEIEKAEVETNSQDLSPDERLGHYPGSALPGEVGNAFIYGHSVLPMFYDPKNYRTIFSTLDKLEAGDKIAIEFGKRSFLYVVEKAVVRKPEDVKPLEPISPPSLGESYLTLMTCVPMGLNTNRLLVQSKLVGM
jgi:sortase A